MFNKIVWLTGMPRSGTTWVSQFFAVSPIVRVKFCPLFSYAFKNTMSVEDDAKSWRSFFREVYMTPDEFMDQLHLQKNELIPSFSTKVKAPDILFIKSNRQHHLTERLLENLPEIKFIAIIRNPFATIHSWLENPTEFPSDADPLQEWRTGTCRKTGIGEYWGFNDWKSVTMLHLHLEKTYPDRFFLYRYEDILKNPVSMAKEMYSALDIEFSEEVAVFITESRTRHDENPRSVFKAKRSPDRWRNGLDPNIIKEIKNDLLGTDLERFLLI